MRDWRNDVAPYLPEELKQELSTLGAQEIGAITDLRLRAFQRSKLVIGGRAVPIGGIQTAKDVRQTAVAMLGHALQARENELRQGFVTLRGGHRAGLCGRVSQEGKLAEISSISIRIAREIPGAAERLRPWLLSGGCVQSMLIVSPPGFGKTTLLRDAARMLSNEGLQVAIADERSEIAACEQGVPQLDVGENTDVMDGCSKQLAIPMLIRAMRPQVIVTDEIGNAGDAALIAEAVRCGVAIIASAHGKSICDITDRMSVCKFGRLLLLTGIGGAGMILDEGGKRLGFVGGGPCGDGLHGGSPAMVPRDERPV